ncbi:hypothetical protein NDN08_001787 [Rhodosorus marinus]|uniref:G domain-containing protein n=1 Tax=Rhodosorus marinus TaxID=101924 RepID=A0AAV8URU3_9RHOD|nr:hypothetical protein NDN08_001787 [Rhodosorus marinus]
MVLSAIDFEGTYIDSIRELIGKNPLILAVTKIDLICNTRNLNNVEMLRRYFRSRAAAMKLSVIDVVPVSGVNGVGVDNLKSLLENTGIFRTADVYIVGVANVGKSTLVNCLKQRFLGNQPRKRATFDAEKDLESVNMTTSSLPGTTLALTKVGRLATRNTLYDTPGILKNMYRHPSTKENLHQVERLTSVALSVPLNKTIVIGDDVLHVDLVSVQRSLDAMSTSTRIVWRSVAPQIVKVVEHRDSRRRQLEMSNRVHAERKAATKRSEELWSTFYSNEGEDARMETEDTLELTSDDLESWDHLSVPHTNISWMGVDGNSHDIFAEIASETNVQISHELLRTAIVPRLDEDGYKAYCCDVAAPGLGFLAIRSPLPLYVRIFGPAQMRCMIRPQLPVDNVPEDASTSRNWKLHF